MKSGTALKALAIGLLGAAAAAGPVAADEPVVPRYGTIRPFEKDVQAYWGNINPFYGNIGAFWGNINPFAGDIGAFWGTIRPFDGDLTAQWGNIGAFWGDIGASWGTIRPFWDGLDASDSAGYAELASRFKLFMTDTQRFWTPYIRTQTGLSFYDAFGKALLAKYGINMNRPETLAALTPAQRSQFIVDLYDGLMGFSGADHVDHWMKTVNWTPALTQQQGGGARTVVGLLDFFAGNNTDIGSKIVWFDGVSTFSNGHGAAVASLIVSAHDGKGVMGIAPNAAVVAYNPFDATGTAGWADVTQGVGKLKRQGASVVNMSLGVAGWTLHPDWQKVFADPFVTSANTNTVFVIAAGNDGITQTQNVYWDWDVDPNMIIVGSVDPTGTISDFSNRPGSACLMKDDGCKQNKRLRDRFIVAPGELILIADDSGGVARQSGTSFAAPLVSGAIALLHDRWPWLARFPAETIDIILSSATDLGERGTDNVYGRGLLNVTASQSPLDFNKLTFYEYANGTVHKRSAGNLSSAGIKSSWEIDGAYFIAFETIGKTERDFAIPLSSRLANQTVKMKLGEEQFQQFLYQHLTDWIGGKVKKLAGDNLAFGSGLSTSSGGWNVTYTMAERPGSAFHTDADAAYAIRVGDDTGTFGLTAGYGLGAAAFSFNPGFDRASDFDITSGVNPYAALANGAGFVGADFALDQEWRVAAGVTTQDLDLKIDDQASGQDQRVFNGLAAYRATALQASVTYTPFAKAALSLSYTRLEEPGALLGVQWRDGGRGPGSTTDALSVGAYFALEPGLDLALSASVARTEGGADDNLRLTDPADSSAFRIALSKHGLFADADALRIAVSQPMHVANGTVEYTSVEVVDRETGAIGPVTRRFGIAGERFYVGEISYGAALLDGRGALSLFARSSFGADATGQPGAGQSAGVALRFGF
ncbi:MAG: S8 family serine peptidase [Alphaproteobacteria bacterium]|nr:S8 family serine peptidase [Alphaproteobacteria bacterium]